MSIEEYKKKIKNLEIQIDLLTKEKYQLENDYEKFVIDNKLYETDLSKYRNKPVKSISIIVKRDDKFIIEQFFDGKIDKYCHADVYEFWDMSNWGYRWSKEDNSYIVYSCSTENRVVDVIGFFDIELEEDNE